MLVIPAIDLKDGCVVRLFQGRFEKVKVYSHDPLRVAKHWSKQGAKRLHVVDLDGALTGSPKNLIALQKILKEIDVPVEFGGGVRQIKTIELLLKMGVSYVVLGTKAAEDKCFLEKALEQGKDRLIVSVDVQGQKVAINGWRETVGGLRVEDFILALQKIGFSRIIYTDVQKDGTLSGPNIKNLKAILKLAKCRVLVSGGVSCLEDIRSLSLLKEKGLEGVIVGKALYEGKFTLTQAAKIAG